MAEMRVVLVGFMADESGATAIEYGLIAAGIAIACIVAITTLGNSVLGLFVQVDDRAGAVLDGAAV